MRSNFKAGINLNKPTEQIVADMLDTVAMPNNAEPAARHLVGATLALRYPKVKIENYSYATEHKQIGRNGDFLVNDTVFHVTVAPGQDVVGKCESNFKKGFRPCLLVSESKILAARQLAELAGIQQRVGINSIERFVGQIIEELGEFGKAAVAKNLRGLLEKYNERVLAVETDRSLLIDIPENL